MAQEEVDHRDNHQTEEEEDAEKEVPKIMFEFKHLERQRLSELGLFVATYFDSYVLLGLCAWILCLGQDGQPCLDRVAVQLTLYVLQ